jgi:protein-arginine kinase activator protein McsA
MSKKNFFNDFDSFFNEFDNFFNQPFFSKSIGQINGNVKNEEGEDENGKWSKQTISSKDGSFQMITFSRKYGSNFEKSKKIDNLSVLKKELEKCVENQEFEKACEIRDKIKFIEENKEKISTIKIELDKAIKEQNFEKAIELRDQLKDLE